MLQAETEFVSKRIVIPFRCPCPPFIAPLAAQTPVFSVKGKRSNHIPICCQRRQMATIHPRSNSETWSKDARCPPQGIGKQV
ncbi:hypothetical protein TNCV_5121631 [Trichonephila clavipes]|nr:hypothetical protein TNCV_5121631 [Trichonephila clavipes]